MQLQPKVKTAIAKLKDIDFELAYLALLTIRGIKPLSRWEKPLADKDLKMLQQIGLFTKRIKRTVKTGKIITETIFGKSVGYIEIYEKRFGGKPIDKSAQTTHFEGFLFGYPPCCVDQYIRKPYAKNDLAAEKQKILFHWACKNCKITPILLPIYENIYKSLKKTHSINP